MLFFQFIFCSNELKWIKIFNSFQSIFVCWAAHDPRARPRNRKPGFILCFFVGDAFQLTRKIMKLYADRNLNQSQKIFNYRLSRARRTIENAFEILVSRWKIFRKPIYMNPAIVDNIVIACVCLHNFLKTENDALLVRHRIYCPANFVDSESQNGDTVPGEWRNEISEAFRNLAPSSAHRATKEAYNQKDSLANFFLIPKGEVPWQYTYIRRGFNSDDMPDN